MPDLILRVQVHERILIFNSIKSPLAVTAHSVKQMQMAEGIPFLVRYTAETNA